MGSDISRADREARRHLLQESLERLAGNDDPDRAAYEAMRALDAYLDAHESRHPVAPSRELPVIDGSARPGTGVGWLVGLLIGGAVIATVAVTVTMSGGWPAGIAVAAIWLATLVLLITAGT